MTIHELMRRHGAAAEQIDGARALAALLEQMEQGLAGHGRLPMLPSYLGTEIAVPDGAVCCVLDAGGTNLRTARAVYADGWHLEDMEKTAMPGTSGELSHEELYAALAEPVRALGSFERVGFCFSYNVTMGRELDGTLDFWCKEVRAPEAVGRPVGASLRAALGEGCQRVHVLNDSVAAMLGAGDVQVGVILGTGVNVCYAERCSRIPKVPADLRGESMIISTEVGEFDGFPRSDFEALVMAASDAPEAAPAEKQCSGGYLGQIIAAAWAAARDAGLLEQVPPADLGTVSALVEAQPDSPAGQIAKIAIVRAAKIAAVLCAGPILRAVRDDKSVRIAVEGSQYWRLTGFREDFHRELAALIPDISWDICRVDNACLIGAARAAFANPM